MWTTLLYLALAGGCCNPAIIGSQPVAVRGQETSMWCWAASGEMCMEFLGSGDIQQCEEANRQFSRSDCCNSPTPGDCVQGGWPDFNSYGFNADRTSNAALTWAQVKEQIYCRKKPVAFSWHWSGGGGHMMVLVGYVTLEGTNYVTINDPLPVGTGSQYIRTYDFYVSGSGHTHWDDFYNITKR
jgi:hypothetical protein